MPPPTPPLQPPSPSSSPSPSSRSSTPVFSTSRSPSPPRRTTTTTTTTTNTITNTNANLPSSSSTAPPPQRPHRPSTPPSDLPHLIRTHQTQGYRAGISAAKDAPATVQPAFDAGYPLGAELGFRAGWLLAVVAAAAAQDAASQTRLLKDAERDLSVGNLVAEMEAKGMLGSREAVVEGGNGGEESWTAPAVGFVEALPSVRKWAEWADEVLRSRDAV